MSGPLWMLCEHGEAKMHYGCGHLTGIKHLCADSLCPGGHPVEGGDADELFKWLLEIGEVELRVGYGSDSTDLFCRYVSTSMVRVPRSQWEHLL